jgi:integrase
VDIVAISKRLGHAQVSTTTDIYSHPIKEADAIASESVADAILRPKEDKKRKRNS